MAQMAENDPRLQMMVDQVEIFHGLTTHDVYRIFSKGMTHVAQKDQMIFHKETVGNNMFVVLGGKVGVFDGPKMIAELGVGATFGEMSLLLEDTRSATIKALELTNLFALDERLFQKLLTKRVAVQMLLNISRSLAKKVKNANMMIREMEGR